MLLGKAPWCCSPQHAFCTRSWFFFTLREQTLLKRPDQAASCLLKGPMFCYMAGCVSTASTAQL